MLRHSEHLCRERPRPDRYRAVIQDETFRSGRDPRMAVNCRRRRYTLPPGHSVRQIECINFPSPGPIPEREEQSHLRTVLKLNGPPNQKCRRTLVKYSGNDSRVFKIVISLRRRMRGVRQFTGGGKPWDELFASQRGGGEFQPRHTCSSGRKMRDASLRRRRCSLLQISGALRGNLHSLGQSRAAGFGRQPNKPKHRGDLILVLLHAPVEGSAVFRTDQRLRRTRALGHVRYIKPVSVYYIVEVAPALFPDTKTVNAFGGITSKSL
jgi:hypothetical protein